MELHFDIALKRIITEELTGNNPLPDLFSFLNLRLLLLPDFRSELASRFELYKKGDRIPSSLLRIDIPKPNFTIRPMARPDTKDWLLYEAIIDYLSDKILNDQEICKRSYSILNFKNHNIKKTQAWLKFDARSRELYYDEKYKYVVMADLTGYYENVNLEELRRRIINYLASASDGREIIHVLFTLLRTWSDERISGYGLPQGPPASAFLADIFLDYVDRRMEKYDNYFRYMDDIRIFCKQEIQAKLALKDLTTALRDVKLNINAKKTEILKGKKIEEQLFDPHKSLLNIIETTLKSKNKTMITNVIPALTKLFQDSLLNDPFEKTHLNFSLYRLGILYSSGFELETTRIVNSIRNNFVQKPHHAGLFCGFLTLFSHDHEIARFLVSFLRSKNNIYEWQELKVLQALLKFNIKLEKSDIDFCISCARNSNKHFAVRGFYFLLAGKYGSNRDRELIVDSYKNLSEIYTKIAVVLAVQELGQSSRQDFYSRVKRNEGNVEVNQFLDYIKSLSNPIYYLVAERPKIETYEEFERPPYE
jgi:hypothetical protein